MSERIRTFGCFGLVAPLLGFVACAGSDSAVNSHESGLPQGGAGTLAVAGASGAGGFAGRGSAAAAGSTSVAGNFGQAGSAANGGAGGMNANLAGAAGNGLGGLAGVSGAGSAGAGSSNAGSAGLGGSAGASGSSAAFAQVSTMLGKNCGIKGCHADKQTPHFVPGAMLYETLTGPNTVLAACGYTKFVEAGDPSKSALVLLMNGQCDGFTMPPSCSKTPAFPRPISKR